jgi:large subunit ribosomal protein L28
MSRKCKLTGKGPHFGNNVSFSHKRTKKVWLPNMQRKAIYVPELGRTVRVRISARALRTVSKKGLMPYLRDQGLRLKDIT